MLGIRASACRSAVGMPLQCFLDGVTRWHGLRRLYKKKLVELQLCFSSTANIVVKMI